MIVLFIAAVIWKRFYTLTPPVYESMTRQVALMKRNRRAPLYDPVVGRSFHALEIVAENAAPGDKNVSEYLRYFSRRDLLAFADGWRRRWLTKYVVDLAGFIALAAWMFGEGASTFGRPYGLGGLDQEQHRNLAVLELLAGSAFLFPCFYYSLQFTGVRWVMRQAPATLRRYVAELSKLDADVSRTLTSARSASERGGLAAACGGGWQRVVLGEVLKLGVAAAVAAALHVIVYENPSGLSCHAAAYPGFPYNPDKSVEQMCITQATGACQCITIADGCWWTLPDGTFDPLHLPSDQMKQCSV